MAQFFAEMMEKMEGFFAGKKIPLTSSPFLTANYFYDKEGSFLKHGLFQSPFTSALKLATDLMAFGSGP